MRDIADAMGMQRVTGLVITGLAVIGVRPTRWSSCGKRCETMLKAFKAIGYGLCIVFMAWLLLSWVDIVADNSTPNPHHSEYNAFVLMTKDR